MEVKTTELLQLSSK